jgi:hypothetical protein
MWGREPLDGYSPGELTAEEKIARMVFFEKNRGPLSSYQYVDVRFDNVNNGPRVDLLSNRDTGR